ncbi:neuronal-specific septin-3 isoform X3 [Bubalus kerabau]|uniref:neuronal-specific septin-3 isoform X3 n=1 Tax=Bubalus carabanensis TaxID=3119969 RepID=UPI00244EFD29|nr:neuronal-specific septin-3 isoform X3 [Bubalus carabanensis]
MDHDFEMQPHGAPGPRNSSRSHLLGRPTCPSKLPGGVSPLIPVLRKTFHLDAFSPSHIPQASSRPGLGARAWSVSSQETGKSLASRKFSSISLTVHPHSQARPLGPLPSHWEELSSPGREAATHGGGRLPTAGLSSVTLVPGDRVHSEGPGNPGLAKSSRLPTAEKPLVSSYLTLPFQSRLAPSPPGPVGPGSVGPRHPVPVTAHVPARASPGRGKPRSRGIPRPRLHLQRASPTTGPVMAMDLAALDTKPRTASRLSTRTTNKPSLTVNLATPNPSRLDTGIESLDLDTNLGSAVDVATVGTSKPGRGMDSVTQDLDKVGKAIATEGIAKPEFTTGGAAMERAAPDPVKLGTARPDTVMLVNTAKLGVTTNSPALDTSRLVIAMGPSVPVTPDPAAGETTLDSVINLTTSDVAIQPSMLSQSTDAALGHPTADAATDWATELDRARETKGQSGLGKSTLVNTLFKSQVSRKASSWNREEKIPKTVEIKAIGHVIEEGGVKMKLTVIDTPGFGDQINNENCWEPIEKYINEQYEKFLKEEVNIARKKRIPDTRVHCCLYFISPTGHSLRPLDLEFMKHLSKVVNIIPVIAKADTMTLEEKSEFKQRVRKELEVNGIEFYPQKEFDEDLEDKTENDKIRQESMPFAVVGSDKEYQVNGKRVLGRKTPWGIIEVENLNHCEFALLRDFVIRTHLQDLKEVTHNIHYETYRAKRLNDNGGLPPGEGLLGTVLPPVPATPCPTAE